MDGQAVIDSGMSIRSRESNRALDVEGTFNVRDVGGVSASDGATMAQGRLFRSASLDALTDRGLDVLRSRGLRTVIDLRSQSEVDRHGRFPTDRMSVRWEHLVSSVTPPPGDDKRSIDIRAMDDPMTPMPGQYWSNEEARFGGPPSVLGLPLHYPALRLHLVVCPAGTGKTTVLVFGRCHCDQWRLESGGPWSSIEVPLCSAARFES